MDRRGFLGGAAIGLALQPVSQAFAATSPGTQAVIKTYVTNASGDLASISGPVAVQLHRQPSRRFDRNSVAVVGLDQQVLGYLPGTTSAVIAPLIDAGLGVEARLHGRGSRSRLDLELTVMAR